MRMKGSHQRWRVWLLLRLNLQSLLSFLLNHRIADVREAALSGERHHLLIQLRRIYWFANIDGHFLLYRVSQLRSGTGDLDKLGNRCCFFPGFSVGQILLPLGFAYRKSESTFAFEAAASYPAFMIASAAP